jgi:transcriptional regulator with XRE-family HTH domain
MITLQERIDDLCKTHGSLRKAAKAVDVDFGYLSDLRSGDKTNPSLDVLEKLGLRRVVHYVLK